MLEYLLPKTKTKEKEQSFPSVVKTTVMGLVNIPRNKGLMTECLLQAQDGTKELVLFTPSNTANYYKWFNPEGCRVLVWLKREYSDGSVQFIPRESRGRTYTYSEEPNPSGAVASYNAKVSARAVQ